MSLLKDSRTAARPATFPHRGGNPLRSGMAFEEVRERGRWTHDKSLRTYLDVVGAANLEVETAHVRPTASWLQEDFRGRFCWWPGAPPPEGERYAGCGRVPGPVMRTLPL